MVILHSYVSLPEGIIHHPIIFPWNTGWQVPTELPTSPMEEPVVGDPSGPKGQSLEGSATTWCLNAFFLF